MYRRLYHLGIAAYAVMFLFAIIFYKERIIFLDTAFVLFHMLKDGAFDVQIYRLGDAFSQIMPLLASKAGSSLNTIIMSYSVGLISSYFIPYIICGSILKQYRLALFILLLNLLFASDTFYWPISQVPQGMALLVLILALINGKEINSISLLRWALLLVLLVVLVFFHPLMLMVTGYALVFFFLSKDQFFQKKMLYLIAGLFFVILIIKMTLFKVPYERHSLSGLKNFVRLFPDYIHLYSNKQFLHNCVTKYYWIPILSAGIIIVYARAKEWMKLGLFLAAMSGYFLLVNVSYPTAETPQFYIENLYLPLGFFIVLPFLFDLAPLLEKRKLVMPVIVLIMITGCIRIYTTHTPYTARLAYERHLLDQYGDKKVILAAAKVDTATLQMVWGSAYEFWLLSTSERGYTASINIDADAKKFGDAAYRKKSMVVTWDAFRYDQLDPRYFQFKDTTTGYIIDPSAPLR